MNDSIFQDRTDAGKQLGNSLASFKSQSPLVLALPRGGLAIGFEVARILSSSLDTLVVRKIAAPGYPEFGVGAIAEGGIAVFDRDSLAAMGLKQSDLKDSISEETAELERRIIAYRGNRRETYVRDKVVIVVDDGLATGVTARAAIESIKLQNPKKLVLAVPVCSKEAAQILKYTVDEFICLHQPEFFSSVGQWYKNFEQLSDEDVIKIMDRAHREIVPKLNQT